MGEAQREAGRWMLKADRDLRTAATMLNVPDPPTDIVCFDAQQCAEKALKGWLTAKEKPFPRTHDLPRLLRLCVEIDETFHALSECTLSLADYAVEPRYPDDWREISQTEAHRAVQLAEMALGFVRERLPG